MNTYKLINHEFARIFRKAVFIYATFIILEFLSFFRAVRGMDLAAYRFEQVLDEANIGIIFLLSYIAVLICIAWSIFELYMGGRAIYSVLRLPVSSEGIYLSILGAGVACLLILACLQSVMVIAFGHMLPGFFPEDMPNGPNGFTYMNNYIPLAFLRCTPISFLFPITFIQGLRLLFIIVAPVIAVISVCFSVVSKKYHYLMLTLLFVYLLFRIDIITVILISAICIIKVILSVSLIKGRCVI